jgi:hypothetical protein
LVVEKRAKEITEKGKSEARNIIETGVNISICIDLFL